MSTALYYTAKVSGSQTELQDVIKFGLNLVKKRKWANEGFSLEIQNNKIIGSTKLFDGSPGGELSAAAADVKFIVSLLQKIAKKYNLIWDISCPDKIGTISASNTDPRITDFISFLSGISNELGDVSSPAPKPKSRSKIDDSLITRWSKDQINKINESLKKFGDKNLGKFTKKLDGRYDLRGFPLNVIIHGKSLGCIDFSFCELSDCLTFSMCKVDNCLFEGLKCWDGILMRGKFKSCVFSNNLSNYHELHGTFINCKFIQTKMTGTKSFHSAYKKCDFSLSNATSGDFSGASFIKCNLTNTRFNKANFSGTYFEECDLKDMKAIGAMYEEKSKSEKGTIFRSCINLDPEMIALRHKIVSDLPQIIS